MDKLSTKSRSTAIVAEPKKRESGTSGNQHTSYAGYRRRQLSLTSQLCLMYHVDKNLVVKIFEYSQMLPAPGKVDVIGEHLFKAQLAYRFGITSKLHLQCIYEAVTLKTHGVLRVEDYVRLLCTFFSDNLDLKINYVFSVYDTTSDGVLTYYELYQLLRLAVQQVDDDDTRPGETDHEPVDDLIDIIRGLIDQNKDGRISLEEYRNYVKKNILFIQLFGQVLPTDSDLQKFKDLLLSLTTKNMRRYFENERRRCLNIPITQSELPAANSFKQLYGVELDMD